MYRAHTAPGFLDGKTLILSLFALLVSFPLQSCGLWLTKFNCIILFLAYKYIRSFKGETGTEDLQSIFLAQ